MKALKVEGRSITETDIPNTLESLQDAVGGYIETLQLVPDQAVMIVNEEGLMKGLEVNTFASAIASTMIVGPALIVGVDGDEFTDIPNDVVKCINALFA